MKVSPDLRHATMHRSDYINDRDLATSTFCAWHDAVRKRFPHDYIQAWTDEAAMTWHWKVIEAACPHCGAVGAHYHP